MLHELASRDPRFKKGVARGKGGKAGRGGRGRGQVRGADTAAAAAAAAAPAVLEWNAHHASLRACMQARACLDLSAAAHTFQPPPPFLVDLVNQQGIGAGLGFGDGGGGRGRGAAVPPPPSVLATAAAVSAQAVAAGAAGAAPGGVAGFARSHGGDDTHFASGGKAAEDARAAAAARAGFAPAAPQPHGGAQHQQEVQPPLPAEPPAPAPPAGTVASARAEHQAAFSAAKKEAYSQSLQSGFVSSGTRQGEAGLGWWVSLDREGLRPTQDAAAACLLLVPSSPPPHTPAALTSSLHSLRRRLVVQAMWVPALRSCSPRTSGRQRRYPRRRCLSHSSQCGCASPCPLPASAELPRHSSCSPAQRRRRRRSRPSSRRELLRRDWRAAAAAAALPLRTSRLPRQRHSRRSRQQHSQRLRSKPSSKHERLQHG